MVSKFSETIFKRTYAFTPEETWEGCAARVSKFIANLAKTNKDKLEKDFKRIITAKKFIPGGRYLYSSGREISQINNCLGGNTKVLTKSGVFPIKDLIGNIDLLTKTDDGRSYWVNSEIKSFGIQQLWKVELTRAGYSKIIYATSEHNWKVRNKNLKVKDLEVVQTKDLLVGKHYINPVRVQSYKVGHKTVPSPVGIQHGIWFGDGSRSEVDKNQNHLRLCGDKNRELLKYFELFNVSYPEFAGSDPVIKGAPNYFKEQPSVHETKDYLLGWLMGYFAADGCVSDTGCISIASSNFENLNFVKFICSLLGIGTFSISSTDSISNLTNKERTLYSIHLAAETLDSDFFLISEHRRRFDTRSGGTIKEYFWNVKSVEKTNLEEEVFCAIVPETHCFALEDEILTGNCFLLKAKDSREGWAELISKHVLALSTGGGVGTEYSDIRPRGSIIKRFGGVASGPVSLMTMVNEVSRQVMAGGKRRSALWAGLNWQHPDVEEFISTKNWSLSIRAFKEKDFNFPAPLDMTNISIGLDDEFFSKAKKNPDIWDFYYRICKSMCKTGEPGFSINVGKHNKETLRNPCTEVVSDIDSDCCNLGSINFARIESLDELEEVTRIAVSFLFLGTHIGYLPHDDFKKVREKNRRIGLGLMGLHEWCLRHGQCYEPSPELRLWLKTWASASDDEANKMPESGIGCEIRPIAVRAIAPTGTIGIIAETTTGVEPIYCVSYKRRFLDNNGKWKYSYVIDPTAERLIQEGISPDSIEDAYSLSHDVERRISMQAFVQEFVDQGISSTINVPAWGEPGNNNAKQFSETLFKYLPKLRGITLYPEGARSGQPLTPVAYEQAIKHKDVVFEEETDRCVGGVCGL